MKRKNIAMALGVAMCASLLAGCASTDNSKKTSSNTVYGEVSKVEDEEITLEVGTRKKNSSEIKKTGEEKEITVTSDTEITREDMGEKPSGEKPSGEKPSGEKPSGKKPSGEKPSGEKPSGEKPSENMSVTDISKGDIVKVHFDEDGKVEQIQVIKSENNGKGAGMGQDQEPESYTSVKEYKSDTSKSNVEVNSTGTDENAIHAHNGAKVVMKNAKITQTSTKSKGGDSSSFYGVGAAILESDGKLLLSDSTVTTNAKGGAGIFAYGKGTVYTADTKIRTSKDTSGGIHVAGGGTLYAWNLDVQTKGESSAAIRSDRGGGKLVADGGTYTSSGTGSPAVYSTADIAVNHAKLTATKSEAVCIEGLNSLRLYNSDLTGNMSDNKQNDCTWNVILYQSMSGDSEVGNSTFEMSGGSLTAKNGGMFYTTNTESTITLSDVKINYAKENEFFLKCTGNKNQRGWGTTGKNGADCLFTAKKQIMKGDIIWDSISKLDLYMSEGSTLTGSVKDDESCAGNGGNGYCNMYIESGSTWTVTGNSKLTNLQNAGTIQDTEGKTVTIKGTDGTIYVKGNSKYTITVKKYKAKVNMSGASDMSSWSDYKKTQPDHL